MVDLTKLIRVLRIFEKLLKIGRLLCNDHWEIEKVKNVQNKNVKGKSTETEETTCYKSLPCKLLHK